MISEPVILGSHISNLKRHEADIRWYKFLLPLLKKMYVPWFER